MEYSALKSHFEKWTGGSIPFEPFWKYLQLLLKWNRKINLTAISEPEKIIELHFLDSLAPLPYLPKVGSLLDFGSGAGFPGIPIKIARHALDVTLCESVGKKAAFLKEVIRSLGLKGITVCQGHLSSATSIGPFDVIVSRGTCSIARLGEELLPLLKRNGRLIIWKGINVAVEVNKAKEILGTSGRRLRQIPYRLAMTGRPGRIVLVE